MFSVLVAPVFGLLFKMFVRRGVLCVANVKGVLFEDDVELVASGDLGVATLVVRVLVAGKLAVG